MRIDRLSVRNYGALHAIDLAELTPFTVLLGPDQIARMSGVRCPAMGAEASSTCSLRDSLERGHDNVLTSSPGEG